MSRKRKSYAAYARPLSEKALQKRKKAQAVKIKKAQTLIRQAHNLIKGIEGHEELDRAKYCMTMAFNEMSRVTFWLDGTQKENLVPLDAIEAELEEVQYVEAPLLPSLNI